MNRSSPQSHTSEWIGSLPEHVDASMVEERLIALLEQLQQAIGQLAQSEDPAAWRSATKPLAQIFRRGRRRALRFSWPRPLRWN